MEECLGKGGRVGGEREEGEWEAASIAEHTFRLTQTL